VLTLKGGRGISILEDAQKECPLVSEACCVCLSCVQVYAAQVPSAPEYLCCRCLFVFSFFMLFLVTFVLQRVHAKQPSFPLVETVRARV